MKNNEIPTNQIQYMRTSVLFVVAILVATFASVPTVDAAVIDLTPDNFDDVVDGSKGTLVEFFAPWCGHCKKLAPEYEILGDAFEKIEDVAIAKVDADAHRDLGSRFGVSGFPTLKWFPKGSKDPKDYTGGRSADELVKWVNAEAGTYARIKKAPTAVNVLTPDTFDDVVMDASKDVLVEFYAPWCGHCKHLKPVFIEAASKAPEGVKFAALDANKGEHGELAQKYKIQGFPTIKYFRKGNAVDYDGDRSVDGFLEFAETMSKPSVTVIKSAEDLTAFDGRKGVRVYGYFADEESDAAKAFKAVADVRFQKQAYFTFNFLSQL
eukprot:TRINITY_DN101_c0_g1_i3.p1 TRINITY_DN101_c0_g1~~TRINITY_DN101_c0_g1_i3.p1  ORF type:complete len:323 (+),score=103.19 TRINITY_DN101_c0_g1_i3:40-1008(+)